MSLGASDVTVSPFVFIISSPRLRPRFLYCTLLFWSTLILALLQTLHSFPANFLLFSEVVKN
ncbi:hypothetical protein BS47DRAFT_1346254, partial [Hydnum rufescens UP504]